MGLFNMLDKGNKMSKDDYLAKQLELQIIELKAQLEGMKKIAQDTEGKNKGLEKLVANFCRSLLEREFALSQIGSSDENILNMDVNQLLDFTARKIIIQRDEQRDKMLSIINEIDEKNDIIEDLRKQITQFLANKDLSKKEILEIVLDKKISQTDEKYDKKNVSEKIEPIRVENNKPSVLINPMFGNNLNRPKAQEDSTLNKILANNRKKETPIKVIEVKDEDIIEEKNLKDNSKVSNNSSMEDKKKSSENVITHMIDLTQIIKNMPEIHWKIFEAIGVKGLSEKSDIVNCLADYYTNIEKTSLETKVDSALSEMKIANVVIREKVNPGWRTFYVFSLSDLGKRIFIESKKFDGEPVLCERDIMVKQHSNVNHGYGIKDCAAILEELGYMDVSYDNKANRVELPNGDLYIPDIIARNPITGEKEYFEYELVHHKQSDFDIKCNKMKMVTDTLHFIVPDIIKRRKIQLQIDDWRQKMGDKIKDITVKATTTRNLKKNKWDED